MSFPVDHETLRSQFMKHVYVHDSLDFDRLALGQRLHVKAIEANPEIRGMLESYQALSDRYNTGMEFPQFYRPAMEHRAEIDVLVDKMVRGEAPLQDWNGAKTPIIEKIASFEAQLKLEAKKLDGAYAAFEETFFKTPEGTKFASYVEAAAKDDFNAFRQEFPAPEPKPKPKPHAAELNTAETKAGAAIAEGETFLTKLGRNKIKAGVGAAVLVAGAGWAIHEMSKRKAGEEKPKEIGA